MATTSIWRVNGWLGKVLIYIENPDKTENPDFFEKQDMDGKEAQGLSDVIEYAVQQQKTGKTVESEGETVMRQFVSGVNCSPSTARDEMIAVKKRFGKEDGTVAYHGYQSFAPGEATPELAHEIGLALAKKLWGEKYQVLVATHLDRENHLHNHFVVNTVSFVDGIKYHRTEQDYFDMQRESDRLCREYGLSVIENPQRGKSKHYGEWRAEQEGRPTYLSLIKADVDTAIRQSMTERQFFYHLRQMGYDVKVGKDIIGSCFGIFFSGEDSGTGQTMQTAVQEINTDYQENLDEIKTSHSYDVLEMSGSRAVWKEVLAVYAVKTTTDSDNAQEVATMDDEKLELLKDIFWQMNEISSSTSTQTETVIETSDDGNGNIVETETTVTQTYLYITVSHKTAEEMANQFGFNEDQREQMAELLADENNSLWSQVLYGITGGDGEIVTVALSQVGNVGGEPYWSWYGFGSRVEWCACFVSWCANECGYIEAGVIPKFAACASQGVPWFQERGLWQDNSYEPRPGDIIFFDWDDGGQDGSSDHVGIVEKVENGRVYTVEGNSGDSVRQNSYPVGYYEIYGYGTPAC